MYECIVKHRLYIYTYTILKDVRKKVDVLSLLCSCVVSFVMTPLVVFYGRVCRKVTIDH